MSNVVIIDYGVGNLKSIQRGLEKVGATVKLSSDPKVIEKAGRIILPGVGAFESGMCGLKKQGLVDVICNFVKTGNPILGICLGMQMFFDKSEEYGEHQGLELIPGTIKKIPKNFKRKIPNIGWASLHHFNNEKWKKSCLENVKVGEHLYFVHSYMAIPAKKEHILAEYRDEELEITAAVKKDNITGLQFHPEKSGEKRLKILNNFVNK